jgi:tetratricopeptide (TPR) repeat protein
MFMWSSIINLVRNASMHFTSWAQKNSKEDSYLPNSILPSSWLADLIRGETCAFLCGAGASALSGLPTSWEFIECIVDNLADVAKNEVTLEHELHQRLSAQRLEYVLQIASQTPGVNAPSCLNVLLGSHPNIIHTSVMLCLSEFGGEPGVLLTTNFDCLFEDAGQSLSNTAVKVLVSSDASESLVKPGVIIFKVHGSLGSHTDGSDSHLASTLNSVGRYLNKKTEKLLDELLQGRTLLVMGYSGMDHYDIIPYLIRHSFRRVVWLDHDSSIRKSHLRCHTVPLSFRPLFRKSGDMYLRGNTPAVMKATLKGLELDVTLSQPSSHNWRSGIKEWVDSLGDRALLVLGDLLLRENEFDKAIKLYESAASALTGASDTDARVKACRNIGAILTLTENPNHAIRLLTHVLTKEKGASYEQMSGLFLELGLAYGRRSSWGVEYTKKGLFYLMQADEVAENAQSESMKGLTKYNLGLFFLNMAQNGDMAYEAGFSMAADAFQSAMDFYTRCNDIQRLVSTGQKLAACHIVQNKFKEAVRIYTFIAWYAKITAYRDGGKHLRLLLGYVASSAGLAIFMGCSRDEVINNHILASLGALTVVNACISVATLQHIENPWKEVKNGVDLSHRIDQQAGEFANSYLSDLF